MIDKHEMFRIVLNKNKELFVDTTYVQQGRGSYIAKNIHAIQTAKSKNLLARSFKTKVDTSIYEVLEKMLSE